MPFDVERLVSLGRVSAAVPSPDGTWLAVAVARLDSDRGKYVSDLWKVSLAGAHPPVQITRGPSNDRAPCFRRDGALGFLSNRNPREGKPEDGDDERGQVWILPAEGGEPRPLTDEPLGVSELRFATSGDRLVVVAAVLPDVPHAEQRAAAADRKKHGPTVLRYRQMPVRFWDSWLPLAGNHLVAYDGEGGGRRDLTPDARHEHLTDAHFDVSDAGDRAVVTYDLRGEDAIRNRWLRVIDCATGAVTDLGREPRTIFDFPRFSPDGDRIACTRHVRAEDRFGKQALWLFEGAGGDNRALAPEVDLWLQPFAWTPDGHAVICNAPDRGMVPVYRVGLEGELARITSEAAGGSHDGIALTADGRTVVGVRHRMLHPPEPFACPLAAGAEPALLGCLSGLPPADGAAIAGCELRSTRTADGVEVPWFFVEPAAGEAPRPLLIWIHGGPIGQFQDGWHWRWNPMLMAGAGYAVALPNPRGSTGLGQPFIEGIWKRWGAECFHDVMAVTDDAAARPGIDAARVGAMGGSFGGYMANWIGGQTDRFRCLVSHAGLCWLAQFYGTTDEPGWFGLEMGGTPDTTPEAFDLHSPHRFLDRWRTPTLIVHGEKDYRVPIGEALTLFEALVRRGVDAELAVFPDENHWILRPRNIIAWYGAVLEFLARHMGPQ